MKICGIYKITNTITGDFYIGSSKDVKRRWAAHKWPSKWNECPNKQLYQDMQKYGVDKFVFEVLAEVEESFLKEKEQYFIETLKPTYNNINAKGWNFERYKEHKKEYDKEYEKTDKRKKYKKEYNKSDKRKEYNKKYEKSDKRKKYKKEYNKSDKRKKYMKEYQQSDKCKKHKKEYNNQLCFYNGEVLTLCALSTRFQRAGISNPTQEAKKYLLNK